jgi:hypothetical protein
MLMKLQYNLTCWNQLLLNKLVKGQLKLERQVWTCSDGLWCWQSPLMVKSCNHL